MWWVQVFRRAWSPENLSGADVSATFGTDLLLGLLVPVGVILAVLLVVGVGSTLAQGGLVFSMENIAPNFERLNPLQGIRRMFSRRAWMMLGVNLAKVVLIAWVCYADLRGGIAGVTGASLDQNLAAAGDLMVRILLKVSAILLVIAALDYVYQWWEHEQSLRMTKEEVEREFKETEGDPRMKGRRREMRNKLIRFQIAEEVPKATAVVTNPTHYAVALRWREGIDPAPVVVAKGMNEIALLIREIAAEHGVPVMENRPLARALYAAVEVGEEIPPDFFEAVARFLYQVFQTYPDGRAPKVRRSRRGRQGAGMPQGGSAGGT